MATPVTQEILHRAYPPRSISSRKYDFGFSLVVGGSELYSGAPALAALAAFRTGVDMVRVLAPKRAADIIASFSPILATYPLEGKVLSTDHVASMTMMAESSSVVSQGKSSLIIGGGIGRSKQTQEAVVAFLSQATIPAVIDADAIHAVSQHLDCIAGKPFVVTPHAYEFSVLTGKKIDGLSSEEKMQVVQDEATRLNTTIVLKGVVDIVSDGKETGFVKAGTPYMTPGGTGDVLAGSIGAFLARGMSPFESGCAGTYLVGRAGEVKSPALKDSLVATDLLDGISEIIQAL